MLLVGSDGVDPGGVLAVGPDGQEHFVPLYDNTPTAKVVLGIGVTLVSWLVPLAGGRDLAGWILT